MATSVSASKESKRKMTKSYLFMRGRIIEIKQNLLFWVLLHMSRNHVIIFWFSLQISFV